MIVTPVEPDLQLNLPAPGYVRSEGLHLSQIYNDLYCDLEPKRYVRGSLPDPLRMEAGLALEEMLESGLRNRLRGDGRPEEFVSDEGIICSPDLIIFNHVTRVGEIKLSWLSTRELPTEVSNHLPPKFSKYTVQMMAYCHVVQTPYARLYFFGVNGGYEFLRKGGRGTPPGPKLLAFDIEFTKRELDENWSMCLNHARSKGML